MRSARIYLIAALAYILSTSCAAAHDGMQLDQDGLQATSTTASSHAPLGVMGDHMHAEGEWMLSYRFMHMNMSGNRDGTDRLDPVTIATTIANPFSGMAGQPPTLRVVPTDMTMDMHLQIKSR